MNLQDNKYNKFFLIKDKRGPVAGPLYYSINTPFN